MRNLDDAEMQVLALTATLTQAYMKLPALHPNDKLEFIAHMHALQNIVLARPAYETSQLEVTG